MGLFIFGVIIGAWAGILLMCLLAVARTDDGDC